MLTKTTAIVLRNKKYGETSCIVTMLTRTYGVQTYMVNGVRKSTKKTAGTGMYFQPANILSMVVYHNSLKQLQRIKTFNFYIIYNNIQQHAIKNMIALFITEILYLCLKQPEENEEIYDFAEDIFTCLDHADAPTTANLPLYFLIHLSNVMGFVIQNNYSSSHTILNLQEGVFTTLTPTHINYAPQNVAVQISHLLKIQHPTELSQLQLQAANRRLIIDVLLQYYSLHITGFGMPKSLAVLKEVLA